jgi:predicted CopG family antitoxin
MATKTISIDIEAYERLKKRKKEGESFSEAIKRLVPKPVDLNAFFRKLEANPVSEEFVAAVEQQIAQRRAPQNMRGWSNGMPGHKRSGRSAAKSTKKRASGGR